MTCDHCGRPVPEGAFCTACGAHQGIGLDNAVQRPHHYAAHPGEHVAQPSVFTTLLPHLPHGKVHEFRWAFLVGVAILVLLVATGLAVAALIAAIFLVPVLYLVYLYEAQVYRDEPALVIGVTFAGGLILGIATTIIASQVIGLKTGDNAGALIGYTVILPIVQLILIPIPALVLRGHSAFPETIDGLVFGVTAGLGFSVAESIVRFSSVFGTLGVHTDSSAWVFPLVSLAVLVPLLHGSTGGAIAAGLWRTHRGSLRAGTLAVLGIPVALFACLAFYLVAQVMSNHGVAPLVVLIYQAFPVGLLLVYIRFLVHHALLDEARDMGFNAAVCPNCHRHVMAAGFCPACGVALRAAPRRVRAAAPASAAGEIS